MNRERIMTLSAFIRKLAPDQYDQTIFGSSPVPDTFGEYVKCGTTACVGGWACALFASNMSTKSHYGVVKELASELLDLDREQSDSLFRPWPYVRASGVCVYPTPEMVADGARRTGQDGRRDGRRRRRLGRSVSADRRTVLLGMNNPRGTLPGYALYPMPPGCAGNRLYEMFREAWVASGRRVAPRLVMNGTYDPVVGRTYRDGFDRRNLLSSQRWADREAREAASTLLPELAGRRVVVLGVRTLRAMGLDRRPWCEWSSAHCANGGLFTDATLPAARVEYACAPHPSGLCREYDDPAMRRRVGELLLAEWMHNDRL